MGFVVSGTGNIVGDRILLGPVYLNRASPEEYWEIDGRGACATSVKPSVVIGLNLEKRPVVPFELELGFINLKYGPLAVSPYMSASMFGYSSPLPSRNRCGSCKGLRLSVATALASVRSSERCGILFRSLSLSMLWENTDFGSLGFLD